MAKAILSVFGGISAFLGIVTLCAALALRYRGWDLALALCAGSGLLLAAGPLLGLAEIIHLLERIAHNTEPSISVRETREPIYTVNGQSIR